MPLDNSDSQESDLLRAVVSLPDGWVRATFAVPEGPTEEEEEQEGETVDTCQGCGDEVARDDLVEDLCPSCRVTCEDCDRVVVASESCSVDGDRYVCSRCYDHNYHVCTRCARLAHYMNMSRSDYDGDWRCDREPNDCHGRHVDECREEEEEERRESSPIDEYHQFAASRRIPLPSPWAREHGFRYLGVELEVEAVGIDANDAARTVRAAVDAKGSAALTANKHDTRILYLESDGSLNDGFEMISAPMGLEDQRALWTCILGNAANVRGLRSHNTRTCGLHVHVSRASLTTTQVARMVMFLNNRANEPLIRAIARRYAEDYCVVKSKQLDDAAECTGDRYEALNLCNSKTVEFRIFRGSLNLTAVLAAVEFANALAEHCRDDGGCDMDFTADAFLRFVVSPAMKDDATNLRAYLLKRGVSLPVHIKPQDNA